MAGIFYEEEAQAQARRRAAEAALSGKKEAPKPQTTEERWESSLRDEPFRSAGLVGTSIAKAAVGDPTLLDPNADLDRYFAQQEAERARAGGDEEGYRKATEKVRTKNYYPAALGLTGVGDSVEAAGQKREQSLQTQEAEGEFRAAQAKASRQQKRVDRAEEHLAIMDGEIREYEERARTARLSEGKVWHRMAQLQKENKEYIQEIRRAKALQGYHENIEGDLDFISRQQELKRLQHLMGQPGGAGEAQMLLSEAREDKAQLEKSIPKGREATRQAWAAAAQADQDVYGLQQRPHTEFTPGEGDIKDLRRLWAEAVRTDDVWKSAEKVPGAPETEEAKARRLAAEDASRRFHQKARGLGVGGYLGDAFDVESGRSWEEMSRAMLKRALQDQDQEYIDTSSADIQRAQRDQQESMSRVRAHEAELRRGVTAGIPGAEPPTPVSPAKIKPGHPGQQVAGLATLAAGAVPAVAVGNYERTLDPYERLRFMSLHGLRRPLKIGDLNTETLGLLLQDPQLGEVLFQQGLISDELQERLISKRQEHGY